MENEVISGHKTLLQKYEIPLEHLDFDYLRTCSDVKKVERIFRILKSGEEGYFPDLTKFAENRLHELDPKNKLLRVESTALHKYNLNDGVRKDLESGIKSWHESISNTDKTIRNIGNEIPLIRNLPPVRALKKEAVENLEKETSKHDSKSTRIKSHEYDKWDKFDADAEALKVDLDEERKIEMYKQKNKKKAETPVIEEIYEDDFSLMTEKERQILALRCKDKGNDFYRAKEYEEAIDEYTKSLRIFPMPVTYNNRAIAYIKTQKPQKAVKDCDKCLEIEPQNIKALIRKGQALQDLDQRRDAYEIYCKVLTIEPNNTIVLNLTSDLRKQLPDLPLPNSTRIKIIDEDGGCKKKSCSDVKSCKNSNNVQKSQNNEIKTQKTVESYKKPTTSQDKPVKPKQVDANDNVLQIYKNKLQEEKKKKQEYKEHFKQLIEGENDVFLLPHHNKRNKEFIIEESKS